VSSLDVSVQARIINMLMDLQQKLGLSYLFISHDLSVVRHISIRIAIMYLGQIVETADTDTIFANAMHPYSIALLSAIPRINSSGGVSRIVLKGDVPSPLNPKPGCRFSPRCWMAHDGCANEEQELIEVEDGHYVFCRYCGESRRRAKSAYSSTLL
jgi:oligopeptide/dipeptide ABC transporter ATP-binding protein